MKCKYQIYKGYKRWWVYNGKNDWTMYPTWRMAMDYVIKELSK